MSKKQAERVSHIEGTDSVRQFSPLSSRERSRPHEADVPDPQTTADGHEVRDAAAGDRAVAAARLVRAKISTQEFQKLFAELQHELFQYIDRRIHKLLDKAVTALAKLLKHPDWRARDAAIEKILRMHAKYVERIDVTGTLEHMSPVRHDVNHDLLRLPPMDDMTDEQRQLARQLLQATRATQPQRPPRVLGVSYDPPGQS